MTALCRKCHTQTCRASARVEIHTAVRVINRTTEGFNPIGIVWSWTQWREGEPYSYEVLALDDNGRPWRVDVERCEMQVIHAGEATVREREHLGEVAKRGKWSWEYAEEQG